MRTMPPALASHLAGECTTLCRCWRLTRRDGVTTGFTDHDADLTFEGVTYAAASGLAPSEAESQLGLSVSGTDVAGALTDAGITEADIAAGLYDDAEIVTILVNWADVAQRVTLDVASIGEIRHADHHFVAELRGPAHRYEQPQGRLYQAACAADFGDRQCGVPLAAHTIAGAVTEVSSTLSIKVAALAGKPAGWASGGRLTCDTGANAGHSRMIQAHHAEGQIELWEALPSPVAVGDACTITAGCDKAFSTCATRFGNAPNFRGFPHIPTPDFILTYARAGEGGHDGGTLDP